MSGGLGIVLIIIVWLFVLAPWLLRSQRPVSHTGEAFDDTRVLFEGDSGQIQGPKRPKLKPEDVRRRADAGDEDYEVVEAEEYPRQTIAGAAAAAKADMESGRASRFFGSGDAGEGSLPAPGDAELDRDSLETIDGEVVEETPAQAADARRAQQKLPGDAELVEDDEDLDVEDELDSFDKSRSLAPAGRVVLDEDALDGTESEDKNLDDSDDDDELVFEEDEIRENAELEEDSEDEESADDKDRVDAATVEVFTAPAQRTVSDDAYELDETFTSPVDLMYPGAVDPQPASELNEGERAVAEESAEAPLEASESGDTSDDADALESEADGDGVSAEAGAGADSDSEKSAKGSEPARKLTLVSAENPDSDELSEEELEFAARRLGRGGWDPVADKQASLSRYQRRQRTLIALVVVVIAAVALGIVVGGWTWIIAAVAGVITTVYLIALRTQVRQEQALRARRIRQLRRARLGVRNAQDDELAIPRNLRRPGAVVLEADDDSPDFDHLPVHFDDDDIFDPRQSPRRRGRDDLAARRVS